MNDRLKNFILLGEKKMDRTVLSKSEQFARGIIQHYNEKKYWKYRKQVIEGGIFCRLKLFYIKRCDSFNNASLGTHLGFGATFSDIPNFPHGLYGIIISHNVVIGSNCTIFHNVTIGEGKAGAPIIGDNCLIGTGAIIIGKIKIGDNVKIGAGAVVVDDVPSNTTIVAQKSRVIFNG
jgi:serine O-acetyltransferase